MDDKKINSNQTGPHPVARGGAAAPATGRPGTPTLSSLACPC